MERRHPFQQFACKTENAGRWSFQSVTCTVLAVAVLSGCHWLTGKQPASQTLAYSQQEARVLDVVKLGTPRAEAIATLKQAGFEGSSGISDSIYYCDFWKRGDGTRQPMNVALLFDQSGHLYKTRPAQAQTDIVTGTPASSDSITPFAMTSDRSAIEHPSFNAAVDNPVDSVPTPSRDATRTPFGDGMALRSRER